jgi:hypothetical protein
VIVSADGPVLASAIFAESDLTFPGPHAARRKADSGHAGEGYRATGAPLVTLTGLALLNAFGIACCVRVEPKAARQPTVARQNVRVGPGRGIFTRGAECALNSRRCAAVVVPKERPCVGVRLVGNVESWWQETVKDWISCQSGRFCNHDGQTLVQQQLPQLQNTTTHNLEGAPSTASKEQIHNV